MVWRPAPDDHRGRRRKSHFSFSENSRVIETYSFKAYGDYSVWPVPNSNTFVQAALDAVPKLQAILPPTAIGKDFPCDGRWFGFTPCSTGVFAKVAGYVGITVGWVEGVKFNFFGAVLGLDVRRPTLSFLA